MITLDILYEDAAIIVVNKPPGLLVTPDRWDQGIPTMQDMLREYLRRKEEVQHPNLRVIHRLDKDTSGAVVFAKDVKAQSYISKQFEAGEVHKTYNAIVTGVIAAQDGMISEPLMESPKKPGTMMVHRDGKKSITLYTVVERFQHYTFVEARPLTGRTHQVRVHFLSIGHPLALDPLYGKPESLYLSSLKTGYKSKEGEEKPIITRLPLHALRLTFHEPTEEKPLVVEAPLPKDFSRMLKLLRKYDSV